MTGQSLPDTAQLMIQVIKTTGNYTERARSIGEQSKQRLALSLQTYERMFAICDISWQQACARGMHFLDITDKVFPSIVTEIEQLAAGSGADVATIAALNARTEILPANYLTIAAAGQKDLLPAGNFPAECTSLAFSQQNITDCWLAQTWDWLGSQREALIMTQAHDDDQPLHITATEAGMLAKIGLNQHGLGITLNILRSPDDGTSDGVPVHLFLRRLLDCESVAEACDLAKQINFCSSSNVLIADNSGAIASLELSPRGVRIIESETTSEPQTGASSKTNGQDSVDNNDQRSLRASLCHTNHFRHPDFAGIDASLTANLSTASRLETANKAMAGISDLDSIRDLLSDTHGGDNAVCRFPNEQLPPEARLETVFAVAMNLSKKEFWATNAQPSVSEFEHYAFSQ